jgi:hypothetical protein
MADEELVDRVTEEAYRLAADESRAPRWRSILWAFRGGFDPKHIHRLVDLAGHDSRVLVVAHHRVWKLHRDDVARKAVKMLQEACLHVLESETKGGRSATPASD